jgi:hypothetical protein
MSRAPLVLAVTAAACLAAALPAAAAAKHPPACAALSFHPFAGPLTAEPVTAGHYKSRFGSIDLLGTADNGQPNYRVVVDGKPLAALKGDIPKAAYPCLTSKHVKTPPKPIGGACVGSRFRVAVDTAGPSKLVMLFALKGDDWMLCQAGNPAK